jgi:uncharacterized membrane protein
VSLEPADLPDPRIVDLLQRQVDRYQGIVTRLAGNSLQVKTWCITSTAAISALAVNNSRADLFGVAIAVLVVFMVLDVNYLWLERRFRDASYLLVRKVEDGKIDDFRELFQNRPPPRSDSTGVTSVLRSFTILPFYAVVAALLILGLLTT